MYWQLQAILEEIFARAKEQYERRPLLTIAVGCVLAAVVLKGTGCIASALLLDSSPPVSFQSISGTIRYEDDTIIPTETMLLCFFQKRQDVPQEKLHNIGCTMVDTSDGSFSSTLRLSNQEEKTRPCIVAVTSAAGAPLSMDIISEEFASSKTSLLTADLSQWHVRIRIPKPSTVESENSAVE